jgi:glutamine transport system substrate-binding protein
MLIFALLLIAAVVVACGEGNSGNEEAGANVDNNAAENNDAENNAAEDNNENNAATDEEMPELTVATDSNYVPFEYLDTDSGEMIGFDIDLINEIADRVGFVIDLEVVEFDGIVAGMGTGRYDIGIAGMTITEERAENFDFSDPYYDAGLIIAVREDEEEIQSVEDLDGKPVATRAGTTSEDYLMENTDAEVNTFPDIVNAYQDLIAGRVDAVVYDVPNVLYYIDTEALGEMKTVGERLSGEQYGIAFPQDSELREDVNAALAEMHEDGTYGDIYEEWFGERPDDE